MYTYKWQYSNIHNKHIHIQIRTCLHTCMCRCMDVCMYVLHDIGSSAPSRLPPSQCALSICAMFWISCAKSSTHPIVVFCNSTLRCTQICSCCVCFSRDPSVFFFSSPHSSALFDVFVVFWCVFLCSYYHLCS